MADGFLFLQMITNKPIGVFDSGYGGLTVLKKLVQKLPQYDYLYLGDNARAPYGTRSFETVYTYTLQCVKWFFEQECPLVILACNTASAKALRTIQQNDLVSVLSKKKVLGVIRPTTEIIGNYTKTRSVGILGTNGTVQSGSYSIEIAKYFPDIQVYQQACPILVPLVENNEYDKVGADYFIKKYLEELLNQSSAIDTILLACTHYPLLINKFREFCPSHITIVTQDEIVADSLADYLKRHPEINEKCSKNGNIELYTTDSKEDFDRQTAIFFGRSMHSKQVKIG